MVFPRQEGKKYLRVRKMKTIKKYGGFQFAKA